MSKKCPGCGKTVFFAERSVKDGVDWHGGCLIKHVQNAKKGAQASNPFQSYKSPGGSRRSDSLELDPQQEHANPTPASAPVVTSSTRPQKYTSYSSQASDLTHTPTQHEEQPTEHSQLELDQQSEPAHQHAEPVHQHAESVHQHSEPVHQVRQHAQPIHQQAEPVHTTEDHVQHLGERLQSIEIAHEIVHAVAETVQAETGEEGGMGFCSSCGEPRGTDGARFCCNCGEEFQ